MKVLYLFFSIEKGGAETYLINLIKGMKNKGVDISLICDHKGYNHKKIENMDINIDFIKMKNIFDISAAYKLAKYCKKNDINVIHTHFLRESFIAALSKLFNPKVKVIWTMHFIYEKSKLLIKFNKYFSKFASKIICVSNAVKRALLSEGIKDSKMEVVYNCVDLNRFNPYYPKNIRSEFKIKNDELLLITVARFQKVKGHEFLIDVLNELNKFNIEFKCLLVGDGKEIDNIKNKVNKYNLSKNVIFTGFREDIPHLLSNSDIYISPSVSEAISFSIIEALACGIPVVATKVGGVPEVLEDSNCGKMIQYGKEKEFAKTVYNLYNNKDEYNFMKKNCIDLVKNKFSLDRMIDETLDIYKEVI